MCRLTASVMMFLTSLAFSQYTITSLKGLEDSSGNTRLIYRFGSNSDIFNSVYTLNTVNSQNSLLMEAYRTGSPSGTLYKSIECYSFWGKDINKYIYGGDWIEPDNHPYISRFDGPTSYTGSAPLNIIISPQNDSLLFACAANKTVRSTDGGRSWISFNDAVRIAAVSPYNPSLMFGYKGAQLARSDDGGISFSVVDTFSADYSSIIYFDKDRQHIYRLMQKNNMSYISVSGNSGQAYSWNKVYSSDSHLLLAADDSASGKLYIASGNKVYRSVNYGQSFSIIDSLDYNITGLYCTSGSEKLFVSTAYFIYKITSLAHEKIFSKIPTDLKEWYPLESGNRKIFIGDREESSPPYPLTWTSFTMIEDYLKDSIRSNGKKYSFIKTTRYEGSMRDSSYSLQRLDTLDGKVYKLYSPVMYPDSEVVLEDLLARPGDEFRSERWPYHYNGLGTVLFQSEDTLTVLSTHTYARSFKCLLQLESYQYKLARQFGFLSYNRGFDFGHESGYLRGMLRRGGVYGDTTFTVSVSDEISGSAKRFELMQNYPNPFNPSTRIKFSLDNDMHVVLNIYNQLGKLITKIADDNFRSGVHEVKWNAANYPSGVYICELRTGKGSQYKKLLLLK